METEEPSDNQHDENKPLFGSNYFVSEARNYLMAEMSMIRGIMEENKLSGRALDISAMIFSLVSTGNAILILSNDNQRFYAECVMLARGFFERMTNACYLCLCDEETYNNCMHHTIYRQYTRRVRSSKAIKDEQGKILMEIASGQQNIEKLSEHKEIKQAIKSIEESNRTRFPLPKIEKRLGFLAKHQDLNIGLFLLYQQSYYDDASEALHGSTYGSLFHIINLDCDCKDKNEVEIEVNKNTSLLLIQTGGLFNELISLLNNEYDLQVFKEKSNHNSEVIENKLKWSLENDFIV